MTTQDGRPANPQPQVNDKPEQKPEPFVPVWLRRRNEEGQAKDLTGDIRP